MSSSLTCALLCSARAWLLPGHDRSEVQTCEIYSTNESEICRGELNRII